MKPRLAIALIAIAGTVLRLTHLGHGLPDFVEEAIPFRKAFEMCGWASGRAVWNPHFFRYPSLSLYLHGLIQEIHYGLGRALGGFGGRADYFVSYQLDPTPMVLAARVLSVLADAGIVCGIAVIGERARRGAGLVAGALVALSPAMILDARSIYSDTLMSCLAVWALERMLAYRERGHRRALAAAVLLIGLAAGAKYPAGLLVLPLAWVLGERHGRRGIMPWLAAASASFIVFLLTSPFIVLDFAKFWSDLGEVAGFAQRGHLGNLGRPAFAYYAGGLARQMGWVALGLLAVSLVLTATDARHRTTVITLWLFLLVFGVPISFGSLQAERYLIPIIPAAAALAAVAAFDLIGRVRGRLRPWLAIGLALGVVVQAVPAAWAATASGADSTQLAARRWLERHLEDHQLLLQEAYGARLPTEAERNRLVRQPAFEHSSPALQQRLLARRTYHAVELPLSVLGHATMNVIGSDGREVSIEVLPSMVDLNQVFYEPGLFADADYVLTSSTVRGRYESDSGRFPIQNRLYRLLDERAVKVATLRSSAAVEGPEITIYHLRRDPHVSWLGESGTMAPLWWTMAIPANFRARIEGMTRAPGESLTIGPLTPDGRPAHWVTSLRGMFTQLIQDFALRLSRELFDVGRYRGARDLAGEILFMVPDDVAACRIFLSSSDALGDWLGAREAVEPLLRLRDPRGDVLPDLQLADATLLIRAGEFQRARARLALVLAAASPGSAVAREAQALLGTIGNAGSGSRVRSR